MRAWKVYLIDGAFRKVILEKDLPRKLEGIETKMIVKFLAVWKKYSVEPAFKEYSGKQRESL